MVQKTDGPPKEVDNPKTDREAEEEDGSDWSEDEEAEELWWEEDGRLPAGWRVAVAGVEGSQFRRCNPVFFLLI